MRVKWSFTGSFGKNHSCRVLIIKSHVKDIGKVSPDYFHIRKQQQGLKDRDLRHCFVIHYMRGIAGKALFA